MNKSPTLIETKEASKIIKVIGKSPCLGMSHDESSVPECEISIQESFLSLKIFEYAQKKEDFGDKIRSFKEKYMLQRKMCTK